MTAEEQNEVIANYMGFYITKELREDVNHERYYHDGGSTPITMWGTEEETLARVRQQSYNDNYGTYSYRYWNKIIPVIAKLKDYYLENWGDIKRLDKVINLILKDDPLKARVEVCIMIKSIT